MIDFRYHIVSLVAVFLALAIGIVIGGFSLQGEVGESLNKQVSQLRSEKNALRGQADRSASAMKKRDQFIGGMLPMMVDKELTGQTIAIIVLPGTDPSFVNSTKDAIGEADGTVASTVYVAKDWISSDFAGRENFGKQAKALGIDTSTVSDERLPGLVLGRAVVAGSAPDDKSKAAKVLPRLRQDKLVTVTPQHPDLASGIVVLWPTMSEDDQADQIKGWTTTVAAIGASTEGVVGVSEGPDKDDPMATDGLVSSLRRTPDSAARMSTVDDGRLAMGQAALVLAMRSELDGHSGQYGVGHDATSTFPKDSVS